MKAELIAEHFAEQGKRLTNLKRVDVSKLDELILKHNIDIERLQKKLARTAEIEKEAKIQREKEYAEKQKIYMEECKAKEEERLRLWNSITEAQQMIICEKLVVRANEEGQNKYDADIVHTNALERKAITAGSRVVREGPTTLRINGVIVQTGCEFTPDTKEDWFSNMPQSFVHMNKYSYEFVLPDIEQMIAEKPVCECCGASDDSVGIATGENGVEMTVCRFCDVDGSNYNGWGDKEEEEAEECERCKASWCDEDNEFDNHHLFVSNKDGLNVCRKCVGDDDAEDEPEPAVAPVVAVVAKISKKNWRSMIGVRSKDQTEPCPKLATYVICASETADGDYHDFYYCYEGLKEALIALNSQKKKKASKKYLYQRLILCEGEKEEKQIKVWQRTKEEIVRPTFHLAEMNAFNFDYTLFKHERGGFCKYAVYNNTANHYVACDFDGEKIIGAGGGTIYKTLNAWTTANWKEQRIKDGNNKTTRNNAYRETKYIPLQMIDIEAMEYGPLYEDIEWESSMSIEKK
jgi:hypothetical protein